MIIDQQRNQLYSGGIFYRVLPEKFFHMFGLPLNPFHLRLSMDLRSPLGRDPASMIMRFSNHCSAFQPGFNQGCSLANL